MHIASLRIENFRNLQRVELNPHRHLNYFYGANGAGKTSILEALVVLGRGRSFRTAQAEELIGEDARSFSVFLELSRADGVHRLGLERSGSHWKARKDGQDQPVLSDLTRHLPLVLMEPNSHLLISGTPDGRRRFLDWGVFHVEPGFLDVWRRYSRVLKQRNAALRNRDEGVLESLDDLAANLGEAVHEFRKRYFEQLQQQFAPLGGEHNQAVASVRMEYVPGWKEATLREALRRSHRRDMEQATTSVGPHRGDILFHSAQKPSRAVLSRGEQKALVAALLLTQARMLEAHGEKPLILLDDLASELDAGHLAAVLDSATACAGQVWITGVLEPALDRENKRFHVEHGTVREV